MRLSFLAVICLTIIVASAGAEEATRAPTPNSAIVPADWQPLHERWQSAMKELNIPGMAIVVVKGKDVVLLDAMGVCDAAGKQPLTPRSPFYLASVTKSFTALGVAILIDEGKVKLDDPVATYLPRFTLAARDKAAKITVRDLLAHRHGLNSDAISMAEAYFGNINDDRYYHLLSAVPVRDKFAYSNLHYTLLGRIIEQVSGKSWKDFLAERVFAPLGMHDATCYASRLYANPLAAIPLVEEPGGWKQAPLVKNDAVMHAAGGMGASASDLANWLRFQLTGLTPDGRRLVSQETLKVVHTSQVRAEGFGNESPTGITRDGYSLGWFTGSFRGHPFLEHGGGYIGTATEVSFLPEDNVGVAVLVNQSRPLVPIFVTTDSYAKLLGVSDVDLLPLLRKNLAESRARSEKIVLLAWEPPGADHGLTRPADRYVGTYENPIWGEAEVGSVDGKLTLQIGTLKVRWHALGDDRLRLEVTPGQNFDGRFKLDADGNVAGLIVLPPLSNIEFRKKR